MINLSLYIAALVVLSYLMALVIDISLASAGTCVAILFITGFSIGLIASTM